MIAYVWVHVGCLPQIHKQLCQQQDRIMNTNMCNASTCKLCVFTFFFMGMRHIPVCNINAWLYIYMLVCVWLYDNVRIMSWWRTQDHIQWVTACHPTWLRMYQFMLVEILGEVPEGSAADTGCGSGGFRCRYLFRFLALVPLPLCSTIALYDWGLQAVNKKWNEAETFKLLGIAPEFIFLGKLWFVGISSVGGG